MPPSRFLPFLHLVTTRGPLAHRPLHNAPAGGGSGKSNPAGGGGGKSNPAGDGDGDGDDDDLEARITRVVEQKLNPAITAHMKRFSAQVEKTLAEQVAKLAPPKPEDKPEDKPAPGGAPPKADPELLKLRDGYEKLQKQFAEESAARKAAEQKAARDATHADLRSHLDALGVKGARARAVIADLEQSGALKLNEESGQYELTVKRARTKGAKPEALTFDDLAAGLKDWAATEDAKEFLPPPANLNPGGKRPGLPATPRAPTNPGAPPRELSDQERAERATETLTKQGIDLSSLLD
jgi:hypothetical protein